MLEPASPSMPRVLGRYEVLCTLGQGGMATLYLARSPGFDGRPRLYAIKLIHEHLCRERAFVQMFLDEARLTTRILHPNVVAAHEVGAESGRQFLVMDYVNGETLAFAIMTLSKGRKKLPIELAMHVSMEIARGLHAAHELTDETGQKLGVVHRDVAPQNVLLGYDGSVRITDFGVAKAKDRASHTEPGMLKGRLAYMAPEHVRVTAPPDRRVDVFSLGAVLWESLAGRRLFRGKNDLETTERLLRAPIPKPSSMRSDVSPELDAIVMKALERHPDARYSTTLELARALEGLLGGKPGLTKELARFLRDAFKDRHLERQSLQQEALSGHTSRIALPDVLAADGFEDSEEMAPPDRAPTVNAPQGRSESERAPLRAPDSAIGREAAADLGSFDREPGTEAALDALVAPKPSTPAPPLQSAVPEPSGSYATVQEIPAYRPPEGGPKSASTSSQPIPRPLSEESVTVVGAEAPAPRPSRGPGPRGPAREVDGRQRAAERPSEPPATPNAVLSMGGAIPIRASQRQVPTTVIRTREGMVRARKEIDEELGRVAPRLEVIPSDDTTGLDPAEFAAIQPRRGFWVGAVVGAVAVGIVVAWMWPTPGGPPSMVVAPLILDASIELTAMGPGEPANDIVKPLPPVEPDAGETTPDALALVPDASPSDAEPEVHAPEIEPEIEQPLAQKFEDDEEAEDEPPSKEARTVKKKRGRVREFELDFDITPSNARVAVDGVVVHGPIRRTKGTALIVEVSAPGFRPMMRRLVVSRAQVVELELEPLKEKKVEPKKPVVREKPIVEAPKKPKKDDSSLLLIEGGDL